MVTKRRGTDATAAAAPPAAAAPATATASQAPTAVAGVDAEEGGEDIDSDSDGLDNPALLYDNAEYTGRHPKLQKKRVLQRKGDAKC